MTEMQPEPQQIPPAFPQNGHRPSERLGQLMETLPQMLASAFASVLQQVPVQTKCPWRCTQCVMNRLAWVRSHERETTAAHSAYVQAMTELAALPDGDPRRGFVPDFTMFLPAHLKPGAEQGMPPLQDGPVLVGGSAWCMEHVPGAPGKTQLLIASAGLTPGMLASLAA